MFELFTVLVYAAIAFGVYAAIRAAMDAREAQRKVEEERERARRERDQKIIAQGIVIGAEINRFIAEYKKGKVEK